MIVPCLIATVIDGDGLRCGPVEVRLLGIDAPDYRKSRPCRQGLGDHVCDDRSAELAKESLQLGLRLGPVRVEQVGQDRYGRILAIAWAGRVNLNCRQLKVPGVRYIARHDNSGQVASSCRR